MSTGVRKRLILAVITSFNRIWHVEVSPTSTMVVLLKPSQRIGRGSRPLGPVQATLNMHRSYKASSLMPNQDHIQCVITIFQVLMLQQKPLYHAFNLVHWRSPVSNGKSFERVISLESFLVAYRVLAQAIFDHWKTDFSSMLRPAQGSSKIWTLYNWTNEVGVVQDVTRVP
jgi:hypothetical protein